MRRGWDERAIISPLIARYFGLYADVLTERSTVAVMALASESVAKHSATPAVFREFHAAN